MSISSALSPFEALLESALSRFTVVMDGIGNGEAVSSFAIQSAANVLNAGDAVAYVSLLTPVAATVALLHKQGVTYDCINSRLAIVCPSNSTETASTSKQPSQFPFPMSLAAGMVPPEAVTSQLKAALQHLEGVLHSEHSTGTTSQTAASTAPAPIDARLSHKQTTAPPALPSAAPQKLSSVPSIPKLPLHGEKRKRILIVVDDASILYSLCPTAATGVRLLRSIIGFGTHYSLRATGLLQHTADAATGVAPLSARKRAVSGTSDTLPAISGTLRQSPATVPGTARRSSLATSSPAASPGVPSRGLMIGGDRAAMTRSPVDKSAASPVVTARGAATSRPGSPAQFDAPAPVKPATRSEATDILVMMTLLTEADYALRAPLYASGRVVGAVSSERMSSLPAAEDFAPVSLLRYVQGLSDVVVRLYPLPSGYSKDVHGRIIIEHKVRPAVGNLTNTTDARRDGSAALIPSVAWPAAMKPESALRSPLSWVRAPARACLFRVSVEGAFKSAGEVTFAPAT